MISQANISTRRSRITPLRSLLLPLLLATSVSMLRAEDSNEDIRAYEQSIQELRQQMDQKPIVKVPA